MEEIEEKFYELVKEQYERTGGSNGLSTYRVNDKIGVSHQQLREAIDTLLKKKKIAILNHLNGISYTLPK